MPKFSSSNVSIDHMTYDNDIATVLPERTDPSQMMPSLSLTGESFVHQFNIFNCLSENGLNLNNAGFFLVVIFIIPNINRRLNCIYETIIFVFVSVIAF